jgi:hypothetical protein
MDSKESLCDLGGLCGKKYSYHQPTKNPKSDMDGVFSFQRALLINFGEKTLAHGLERISL